MQRRRGQLQQKKARLLKEITSAADGIRGTLVALYAMCARRDCECHGANRTKHGLAYYISTTKGGRTHMLYVPRRMLAEARRRLAQYRKLKRALEELVELNRTIFEQEKKR